MGTRLIYVSGLVVLAAATLLAAATHAGTVEQTRESYRKAVEPICQRNVEANERIFAGVRKMVNEGKLKPAARRFSRAAAALRKAVAQLRGVPRPAEDRALLAKWLRKVGKLAKIFALTNKQLRSGQKAKAIHEVGRMTTAAAQANAVVVAFEFRYCRLEPSKFL